MPLYDYYCRDCDHDFSELRPMAQCCEPMPCPQCHAPSPRRISAPRLNTMRAEVRNAHQVNERSQHAPRVSRGHVCGAGCSHGKEPAMKRAPAAKRPWMIGH
jgi:putative FmdB family regulatory protein